MSSGIIRRTLYCLVLITGVVALLPAAAQEADWLVSNERGSVGISSPAADDTINGAVVITGTATSPNFAYYKVEYSVDGDTWFPVDGDAYKHETAVTKDTLTTWDTTVFKSGDYWLRAVVVDNTGNYVASTPMMVTIDKPTVEEEVVAEAEEEVTGEAEEAVVEEQAAEEKSAAPSWLVSNERGSVGISSPAVDDTISGAVVITGTAISPSFSYYKVEYSYDGDVWFPVDGDAYKHETTVTKDILDSWDTTVLRNGTYWLRAVVVDNTGNYVASGPIMVIVDNPKTKVLPVEPDPHEWVPTIHFDGSAAEYCYPDTPKTENDGRCITIFDQAAPVYWEGQWCASNSYKLAYWIWYGKQKGCTPADPGHGDDWEHVILNFNYTSESVFEIESVTFYQHKGWYTRKQETEDINVWIGKIGHGSYHNWCDGVGAEWEAGYCAGGCGYWEDFRNDRNGIQWKPTNLVPLDEAKKIAGPIGQRVANENYCGISSCFGASNRLVGTSGCWQNNFSLWPTSQPTSSYDAPLLFECSGDPLISSMDNSSAITSIYSVHDNHREDRAWTFGCTALSGGPTKCEWTNYINEFDQPMVYTAPSGYFVSGFQSYHDNHREDRRWKVKICEQHGECLSGCQWTGYLNDWDGELGFSLPGKVIAGIMSEHNNRREDRRFSFLLCDLVDCE